MKINSFFVFMCGFFGGVVARSFFRAGAGSVLGDYFVFAGLLLFLSIVLSVLRRALNQKNIFVALFVFSAAIGVARFDVSDTGRADTVLDSFVNTSVRVEGVIVDEPDVRENSINLVVELDRLYLCESCQGLPLTGGVKSKARVTVSLYDKLKYGDRVLIEGKLQKPKNFTSGDFGKEFDFVSYLWKDGIFYQMFRPKIEFVSSGNGNIIKAKLFDFKHALLSKISRVIPDPHASLLGGLIVGAKQSLGKELLDDFRVAGLIHVVVLSGYNITIVAEALMRALSFLPRVASLWFGAGSIVLFAMMVGGGATIVRASIMALIVILARGTGRDYGITRALFIAGFLMVLHNPKILVFDISFQLSFLATVGLVYFAPLLEKHFQFLPTRFQFREFAVATVATQITVLPLLLYQMGELSLVSLPVNLLVLVFIPLTMLFGFLTGIAGFVSTVLSLPFAFLAYGLLAYQLKIVEVFSSLPFTSVQIKSFPLWVMLGFYFVYGVVLYRWVSRKPKSDITL